MVYALFAFAVLAAMMTSPHSLAPLTERDLTGAMFLLFLGLALQRGLDYIRAATSTEQRESPE